jgi:hypothetical protein
VEVLRVTAHVSIRGGRDGGEGIAVVVVVVASGSGLQRGFWEKELHRELK